VKLLTEVADQVEVDRIRLLMESNGIPIYLANEDTARNIGFVSPARQYQIWVYEDEQYEGAAALLRDKNYTVKNPIDVADFHRQVVRQVPGAYRFIVQKLLIPGLVVFCMMCIFLYLLFSR